MKVNSIECRMEKAIERHYSGGLPEDRIPDLMEPEDLLLIIEIIGMFVNFNDFPDQFVFISINGSIRYETRSSSTPE